MRIRAHRSIKVAAVVLAVTMALAPALAEARAGRGGSMGSRGGRTFNSAPATPTAPMGRPVERSAMPAPSNPGPAGMNQARPAPMQPQGSFFQRNPFLGGMLGGLVGAGLIGMLMGGGFGAFSGLGGMLGLLLQLALIGGLAYLAISFFRRRNAANSAQPAYAGAHGGNDDRREPMRFDAPMARTAAAAGAGAAAASGVRDALGLQEADFNQFERRLQEIQAAWSKGDVGGLRQSATPEMVSYFQEQLGDMQARGEANRITDVKLLQGDLAEAWAEGERQYATVAMRWEAKDVTVDLASGRVVEGDPDRLVDATEVWTFQRIGQRGDWLLTAIQQV